MIKKLVIKCGIFSSNTLRDYQSHAAPDSFSIIKQN